MKAPRVLFALAFILLSFLGTQKVKAAGEDKKVPATPETVKALSAEELALQAGIEQFFAERSAATTTNIREVRVYNAEGKLIRRFNTLEGQIPAIKMPKGAEHLMDSEGIAYYYIAR